MDPVEGRRIVHANSTLYAEQKKKRVMKTTRGVGKTVLDLKGESIGLHGFKAFLLDLKSRPRTVESCGRGGREKTHQGGRTRGDGFGKKRSYRKALLEGWTFEASKGEQRVAAGKPG